MKCVWEHNGEDTLLYSTEYVGAYTRASSLLLAREKMGAEIESYCAWAGQVPTGDLTPEIVQEKKSALAIRDADSDVLFDSERGTLSREEYERLKALVLKSARDFHALFSAVPDEEKTCLSPRETFYGAVPRSAREMYEHTKSVNTYYFGELGVAADCEGDIYECRFNAFRKLEERENFLENPVLQGSLGELWTLKKVLRRFLWHDRIHAKAMWRMAKKTFGEAFDANPFCFFD